MKMLLFSSSIAAALFAQASEAIDPIVTTSYAYKDLTISGLLLVAVAYLYRENRGLRSETKTFVQEQTQIMREAAESQSAALGQVAQALGTLENASREQITLYREHINKLVDVATRK